MRMTEEDKVVYTSIFNVVGAIVLWALIVWLMWS